MEKTDFDSMARRAEAKRVSDAEKLERLREQRVASINSELKTKRVRLDYVRAGEEAYRPHSAFDVDMRRRMKAAETIPADFDEPSEDDD